MNKLVAYGDDSDEESPRRRSLDISQKIANSPSPRRRRNSDMYFDDTKEQTSSPQSEESDTFAEPPPPKRQINNDYSPTPSHRTPIGMTTVASVSSLVSYAGDAGDQDEEDNFDKAEMTVDESRDSVSAEPAPPARISQDEENYDEDEKLIDQVLQESNAFKERNNDETSNGSATPAQHDSPHTPIAIDIEQSSDNQVLEIPPSPLGECDPDIQRKFEGFFEKKALGNNFNETLQNMRSFLNPSCYERFIEEFELQEKGSNFKQEIFDPFAFPENCYYDSIAEEQRKIMEKTTADNKSKRR